MANTINPDAYTIPFVPTKTFHRNPYPAILPEKPENSQVGKIIIITGAGSGLGEAAAKVWARAGASGIVLVGRRPSPLQEVEAQLKVISPQTVVLVVKADISNEPDVENLFAQVQIKFGRPADVLLNNAGILDDDKGNIGQQSVDDWWKVVTINLKGGFTMIHHFIRSQPDPKNPVGTIVTVSSGRAGLTNPGGSAYNIAKGAEQRLTESITVEYPTLKAYTTMPGIAKTPMVTPDWAPYAHDHADLVGMLTLYLSQPRADFLKGSMVGVNWDVEELEQHKERIEKEKPFTMSWLPILPISGGKGL